MGKILCATRGGEASRHAQDAAIALTQERGEELVFLHVVDVEFLNRIAHVVQPGGKDGQVFAREGASAGTGTRHSGRLHLATR